MLAAIEFQANWLEVLGAPFMRNALIGGTLVALVAGLVGYFVVVRTTTFAAHALAHIGFPGATGAVLVGLPGNGYSVGYLKGVRAGNRFGILGAQAR